MAQKWNGPNNVFVNYNIPSKSESQMREITNNDSHSSINNQISDSQQILMPTHNSFIEPTNRIKETCLRNSNCNISHSNCTVNHENLDTDQPTDNKCDNHEDNIINHDLSSCFICCFSPLGEKNFIPIKDSTNYSHAPILVLLMDVLGYKLNGTNLHAQVVCKSCYQLLDTIDELEQTLTESKTDLRTKFLETIQKLKLKYPRTDKMLKPRCLRCVQMGQVSSRKKAKGRGRILKRKGVEEITRKGKNKSSAEGGSGEEEISSVEEGCELKADVNRSDLDTYEEGSKDSCMPDGASHIVYDTDPVFFSPDERLKAGFMKENEGSQVYTCAYCSVRYDNTLSLKMHVRVYHMPVIVYDNGQGTAEARYRMGIKLQNIALDEFSAAGKPYSCLFCLSSYKLQSSLQFHFRENHSPHKPFQCLECKECFRRTMELSRHRVYRCPMRKSQPKR